MPSGAAGPLWRMARGTPRRCWRPGRTASGRKRSCKATSPGALARSLVPSSASSAHGCRPSPSRAGRWQGGPAPPSRGGERCASSSWLQRAVSGCPHGHGWQGPSCWRAPPPSPLSPQVAGIVRRSRRRVLSAVHGAACEGRPEHLRKQPSPTAPCPHGGLGHRRQQKAAAVRYDTPCAA